MLAFQRDKRPQVISCRYKCTRAWCYRNRRVTSSFPKTKTLSIFKITQRSTLQFNTPQTHWSQWQTLHIQLIVCTNIGHCAEVQPLSQPSEADLNAHHSLLVNQKSHHQATHVLSWKYCFLDWWMTQTCCSIHSLKYWRTGWEEWAECH